MNSCRSIKLLFLMMVFVSANLCADDLENIGTFSFPTSGGEEAQKHFMLGVGYLHSFGWKQARDEFRKAQAIEPDFAMAYWGETFTYNHPFISEWDKESPRETLMRLGSSADERLAKAPTEREKGFLRAAEAYAFTEGAVQNRRIAWMQAMENLYRDFPDDREVQAFYAVSLLSGATAQRDMRERLNMRAGALALDLFRENENHPGAAHYTIHAFDDPIHAPIALSAARKYAEIAPAVSHARHMPTHIFIQHGMWKEVSEWNESAFQAAADLWRPGDRPGDLNHSSDWGQYGDLQLGDIKRAQRWIQLAEKVEVDNPDDNRSTNTVKRLKARFVIETQQWQKDKVTDDKSTDELLAIGLSAIHLDDIDLAKRAEARLSQRAKANPNNVPLKVSQMEVAALINFKQGNHQHAVDLLDEAVALTSKQRLPNGAANPLKPVHELLGEVYLEIDKPEEAKAMFEQTLLRMPNRTWALMGLARSHVAMNEKEKAKESYKKVLLNWFDNQLSTAEEARNYVKEG